ncbi:MFS transporter [Niabella hibiscisoli]|uniref:MFS transporter n=1 Tax=Niabella hibiscisoli TaxID=1825928 RepID=UPI001F109C5B|nr:MFS transporter [Niabella hibiscisoli]MCH5716318.1 hypothetical protein [Niabella hibiscisoli]
MNFSQSFNGLAWVVGPLIALYVYGNQSHVEGEKMISIVLPFAIIGLTVLAVAFVFMRLSLPEITEADENAAHGGHGVSSNQVGDVEVTDPADPRYVSIKPLAENRHFVLGVIAQACYVAAQTGIFSYLINFVSDHDMHPRFDVKYGPYFLSIGFLLFMLGRITGSAMMKYYKPARLLAVYTIAVCVLLPVVAAKVGWTSLIALYGIFFLCRSCFPPFLQWPSKALAVKRNKVLRFW